MKWNVISAIFKRDFVSYFSSPTGYVFICVFVVLSALATFWPPEFFANNLANLDQLSHWLPFIMLVFIPAITMSIWAEERRQGTDELLLTIPASDFDVVIGKYLAGVAIFTVSLFFSAISIFTVFKYGLGNPDPGLFVSTYVGYWFIGIAMIAIGMVASFLTSNLTVGFILGTLFNLPLALFGVVDWFVKDASWAERVRRWSAVQQFGDFERGVLSLGGMTYFVMIAVVMIYLSMVLIGRRHWQAREEGRFLFGHYALRALALMAIAAGVTVLIQNRNSLRADISTEQLSSLSKDSIALINSLKSQKDLQPIKIDAYVSPRLPSEFAQTKLNLFSTLEELRARGGGKIIVEKHEINTYGPEAELAEKNFGITPQEWTASRAADQSDDEFFLGIAVTSGLDKVVTPFLNKGIPVEYELVRSIMTVADKQRLKIGVVDTGIPMMSTGDARRGEWPLITELRKQYDVTRVDPTQPIKKTFKALLVVQPTMLNPDAYDNVLNAIRSGIPTAVLEDPLPYFYPEFVPGTGQPKQSQMMGMSMFGGGQMEPKGDPQLLFKLLGLKMNPMSVVYQDYAPEISVRQWQDAQWVFVDNGNGAPAPFNADHRLTQGLNQLLFLYPGGLAKDEDSTLKFEQLLQTGVGVSGTVPAMALQRFDQERPGSNRGFVARNRTKDGYILAAQITGTPPEDDAALAAAATDDEHDPADDPANKNKKDGAGKPIKVIFVADIDWIIPSFFFIREGGDEQFLPATQNVPFILNIIDTLVSDERFVEIRKRARIHRTLEKIDQATQAYRERAAEERDKFSKDIDDKITAAREAMQRKIDDIESQTGLKALERDVEVEQARIREEAKLKAEISALDADREEKDKAIKRDMEQEIKGVQDRYKMYAIFIPPIPPLLLALAVFFRRRELERQGVSRERLR